MGAKSVIDIDVDQTKWDRFQQLYDKYSATLEKQPNVWKNVGKEQAAMASQFERMTAAMMAQAEQAREEVVARSEEERALRKSEGSWSSMARSSKSVASNVLHTTTSLLKWSGILTGIAGLIGGGALFGLDKLAAGLGNDRRTSMGLGMSVGQYRAFNLDFSRALDTDKFLGDVQEMMTNPGAAGPLWRLGVNPNGKTEDVATSYMDRLRTVAVSTPTSRIGLLNTQYGTNLSTPEWMRLHEMSADEYGKMREAHTADEKKLEVKDPIARKWQEFGIQLDRAGLQIKNIFETRLEKLVGPLTQLSNDFVRAADAIAKGPLIGDAISGAAKGLHWLADEIGSDKFQQDIKRFEQNVADMAYGIGGLWSKLKWLVGADDDKKDDGAPKHSMWGPGAGFLGGGRVGEGLRDWFDKSILGKGDWDDSPGAPAAPQKSKSAGVDLSNIVGSDPTSWNPTPVSNSYASNRSSVSNTTNNYGARGANGSFSVNIVAPPGFSATTTLAGLNAGLA